MKVLLIKDVYKLGHAGDIKKVADGFGRNYLLPQGLAVLATPGAMKQSEKIRTAADTQRAIVNNEMNAIADLIKDVTLAFAAKAGETGKMYGSITTQDIAVALKAKSGVEVKRQQIDMQPLRALGEHVAHIRLTMDLIPDIKVIVYREGEANPTEPPPPAKTQAPAAEAAAPVAEETPAAVEEQAPVVAEEAPVAEAAPVEAAPVAEEPAAVVEEETPAAESAEAAPVMDETPIAEEQTPVVEDAPVSEETPQAPEVTPEEDNEEDKEKVEDDETKA